jgi:hypothetical protein
LWTVVVSESSLGFPSQVIQRGTPLDMDHCNTRGCLEPPEVEAIVEVESRESGETRTG